MPSYAGGDRSTASYETVSRGTTGHAESVQITFDPAKISYGELLQIFFSVVHDPTQLNAQGNDYGTQYRSAIFYADAEQKRAAEELSQPQASQYIVPGPSLAAILSSTERHHASTPEQCFQPIKTR